MVMETWQWIVVAGLVLLLIVALVLRSKQRG